MTGKSIAVVIREAGFLRNVASVQIKKLNVLVPVMDTKVFSRCFTRFFLPSLLVRVYL